MLFLQWLLSTPKRNQTGQKKWSFLSCFPTLVLHDHHLRSFCSRVFHFGSSMLRSEKNLSCPIFSKLVTEWVPRPMEDEKMWEVAIDEDQGLRSYRCLYVYIYISLSLYNLYTCCLPDLNVGPTPLERNWSLGFRNVPTAWTRQPARLTHRNLKIVKVKVATWWRLVLSFDNIIEDCLKSRKIPWKYENMVIFQSQQN